MTRAHPRLDDWLVSKGHYASRARARDAVGRGCVSLDGRACTKPSRAVVEGMKVTIDDPAQRYVSRAALKLISALTKTGYSPKGLTALDLGASTGGFCQVLLEHNAADVYAVDVGHGQLDAKIANHPRLTNLEGLNARELTFDHLEGIAPHFITSDLSFISLKLALPAALRLAANGAIGIFLIKPQFEVGKDALGKGGIVRDPALVEKCAQDIASWLDGQDGWQVTHLLPSPITGGDGNTEYLLAGRKHD